METKNMGYIPPFSLTNEMIQLTSEISELLGSIKSADTLEKLPRLRRIGRIRTIHSSLAIESNTLTMDQVTEIMAGRRVLGPPNEIKEVKNAFAAYNELERIDAFAIDDLLRIHRMMMDDLVEENGRFRSVNAGVYTGDGRLIHAAPQPGLIRDHMKDLFEWLTTSDVHMLIRSSVFHYEFEFIHPFRDGNGRMGRFWQTVILMKWKPVFAWIPIESVIHDRQAEYYAAIADSTKAGNSNDFIIYMLKAIRDAVMKIVSEVRDHINHVDIRVHKLLAVLGPHPMTAAELMERLRLRSRDSFLKNYIRPAIEAGLVSATMPDRPTNRNQRYFRKIE